jgi:hypothetical protein
MAVKKAVVAKKTTVAKKAPAKAASTKKVQKKGDAYTCKSCGLVVTVDEACGCVDVCDIMCCGEPMKPKKSRAKCAR